MNSFWNLVDTVIYPLLFVVSTPYFIHYLGDERYGLWMLMSSVIVVLHVFNFGLGQILTYYIASYIGSKETPEQMSKLINTILTISVWMIPFLILLGVGAYFVVGATNLFDTSDALIQLSAMCTLYAFASIGFRLLQLVLSCVLRGIEDFMSIAIFTTIGRTVALVINIGMAKYHYDLDSMLLVQVVIHIIICFILFLVIKRKFIYYKTHWEIDKPTLRKVRGYGFWIWSQSIIAIAAFQLDKFLGNRLDGLEVFGFYALASTLINQIHTVLGAIPSWIFPRISKYRAEKVAYEAMYFSIRAVLLCVAIGGLLLLFFIRDPLITTWLGKESAEKVLPFLELFIVFELFYLHTILPNFLLQGEGNSRYAAFYEFVYKTTMIGGMLAGYYLFDEIDMMVAGMILPLLVVLPILSFFTNRKTLRKNWFYESIFIFLPSITAAGVILTESFTISLVLLATTLLLLASVIVRDFSLKELLKE